MEIVPFSTKDQQEAESFLHTIYQEMGWKDQGGELTDLYHYFHLPDGGFFLLAKVSGKIIGTAGCLKLDDKDGLMKRFYVHEVHRGSGVAKKLLESFITTARSINLSRIVLDVSKDNKRAIRFYEKSGLTRYDQKPIDRWPESFQPEGHYYYFLKI